MRSKIDKLNPELKDNLYASRRRRNINGPNAYLELPPILTLLHFSDIHEGKRNLKRIVALMKDKGYKGLFEDAIFTGDFVRSSFQTGIKFWNEVRGTEKILTCIGNHDTHDREIVKDRSQWKPFDWSKFIPQKTVAETFIEPFVPYWEGDIEYTKGTTYYRKIYPEHKIMLITLNTHLLGEENDAEMAFFKAKLNEAKEKDLGVVVALHDPPRNFTKLKSNFCSIKNYTTDCGGHTDNRFLEAVKEFKEAGGEFICYLCGHTHNDYICYKEGYEDQIFLVAGCAFVGRGLRWGDCERIIGRKSEDLFNFVSIDRTTKTFKIVRVGADRGLYMQSRKILTFDYNANKIIYEE